MKTIIYSLLILLPALVTAQDVLYKTDNSKQEVKIVEVNETTIKYKAFNNPDGPFYTISKNNVVLIVYQNGQHEVFKSKPVEQPNSISCSELHDMSLSKRKEKRYFEVTKNKNVFFFNTIELLNSGIGVSYMREVCDNRFLIHVPFASSFNRPELDNALNVFGANYYTILKTHYDVGIGFYINTGKRSITHFIGPLLRNASYSGIDGYSNRESFQNGTNTFSMNETSLMLNNGFLYRFTPRFNMMIHFAVGQFINRTITEGGPHTNYGSNLAARNIAIHAGFHFGYRF